MLKFLKNTDIIIYIKREGNVTHWRNKNMKTTKCIIFNADFAEEFEKFCNKNNFYRSDFINTMISTDIKMINSIKIEKMVRRKTEKKRMSITVDEDKYMQISKPISPRLEEALKIVIDQYENGSPRYTFI